MAPLGLGLELRQFGPVPPFAVIRGLLPFELANFERLETSVELEAVLSMVPPEWTG